MLANDNAMSSSKFLILDILGLKPWWSQVGANKQILYFKNLTLSTKVFINVVFPVPSRSFNFFNWFW